MCHPLPFVFCSASVRVQFAAATLCVRFGLAYPLCRSPRMSNSVSSPLPHIGTAVSRVPWLHLSVLFGPLIVWTQSPLGRLSSGLVGLFYAVIPSTASSPLASYILPSRFLCPASSLRFFSGLCVLCSLRWISRYGQRARAWGSGCLRLAIRDSGGVLAFVSVPPLRQHSWTNCSAFQATAASFLPAAIISRRVVLTSSEFGGAGGRGSRFGGGREGWI